MSSSVLFLDYEVCFKLLPQRRRMRRRRRRRGRRRRRMRSAVVCTPFESPCPASKVTA